MPPAYVKPYVKRHKNDATDAEAICEAVTRANMRFVATKTPEQQSCPTLHRTRHLLIRQQTSVINAIRAHLAEFGIVAPIGRNGVEQLLGVVADANDKRLFMAQPSPLSVLSNALKIADKFTVAMEAVGNKIRLNSQGWEDVRVIGERQVLMVVAYKGQLYLLPEARPAKFENSREIIMAQPSPLSVLSGALKIADKFTVTMKRSATRFA